MTLSEMSGIRCLRGVETQYFIVGSYVEDFERKIADYCGCEYAVGVSSGVTLNLSLLVAGIGQGDSVITTPIPFCYCRAIARLRKAGFL
jgi:dTDP-4-amino-4,6-dideoxygalactose transaminase